MTTQRNGNGMFLSEVAASSFHFEVSPLSYLYNAMRFKALGNAIHIYWSYVENKPLTSHGLIKDQ